MSENIRWQQRMDNFERAFSLLGDAVHTQTDRPLNELEEQGLIQRFEFTHELAWNVLKDYFAYQGNIAITGSRDAIREAFNKGLIQDGEGWMDMIKSRNLSAHTYDEAIASAIANKIATIYYSLFADFKAQMNALK
jgi:nucleotidyltransferase substrate binding protein (TIGR01987 family)